MDPKILLLHDLRWLLLPYPGLQSHEDTPNEVLHTSCFSIWQVVSSPTMQVSIRIGGAGGLRVGTNLSTYEGGRFIMGWLTGSWGYRLGVF